MKRTHSTLSGFSGLAKCACGFEGNLGSFREHIETCPTLPVLQSANAEKSKTVIGTSEERQNKKEIGLQS